MRRQRCASRGLLRVDACTCDGLRVSNRRESTVRSHLTRAQPSVARSQPTGTRLVARKPVAPAAAAPTIAEHKEAARSGDAAIDAALSNGDCSDELAAIEAEMARMQLERKAVFKSANGADKAAYTKLFSARMRLLSARKAECARLLH